MALNLKFIIIIHDLTRYIFHITMYICACSWLLTTVWMTCFDGFWASQQRKSVISVDGVVIHFTGIFQGDLYCIFGIARCYSQNCKNSVMTSDNNKTFLSRPLIAKIIILQLYTYFCQKKSCLTITTSVSAIFILITWHQQKSTRELRDFQTIPSIPLIEELIDKWLERGIFWILRSKLKDKKLLNRWVCNVSAVARNPEFKKWNI